MTGTRKTGPRQLASQGSRGVVTTHPIGDQFLNDEKDGGAWLMNFYKCESPVRINIGNSEYKIPFAILVDSVGDGALREQKIIFDFSDESEYQIPNAYDDYILPMKSLAEQQGHYNGKVLRLKEVRIDGHTSILAIQKAWYFDSLATSFSLEHVPAGFRESLRERLHGKHHKFKGSVLVDHIGLVCMVESADGFLVIQDRGATGLSIRGNSLSSSVSGVLKYDYDVLPIESERNITLNDIANGTMREAREELGIEVANMRFLGAFREMRRGGKPEIYFFARSDYSISKIQESHRTKARTKSESKQILGVKFNSQRDEAQDIRTWQTSLDARVQKAISDVGDKANMTLVAGILLSARHVRQVELLACSAL